MAAENKTYDVKFRPMDVKPPVHPDLVCPNCVDLQYGGWYMEVHCGYCSNTQRTPIPFSEVWGIE